jgi:hypothetical protein
MLEARVVDGYCSRQLAADACPYANICEQCDNYVTAPEFIPQLQAQLAGITALRGDDDARGWHTGVARHSPSSPASSPTCNDFNEMRHNTDPAPESRLIECWFSVLSRKA